MRLEDFVFFEKGQNLEGNLIVVIPNQIHSKKELLHFLAHELRFPKYYGMNWDALSDCLRNLDWLPERRIIIKHEGLPLLPREILVTYLEILSDASHDWILDDSHQLVVAFPETVRNKIRDL